MSRTDAGAPMRGEFLDAYLGEVDELLGSANALLLAIDGPQRRGESTPKQVRELFRALHTVKGLSAMVGVDPVVALSHRAEAVLRTADRSGGRLAPGTIDLLLQAVRSIEQRVQALAAKKSVPAAPQSLLEALDALDESAGSAPRVEGPSILLDPSLAAKMATFERQALAQGVREGKRAICVRFAPSPALAAGGVTINTVRERLGAVCEIVKVLPLSVPKSESTPAGLAFALLGVTSEDDASLSARIGVGTIETLAQAAAAPAAPVEEEPVADDDIVHRSFVRVGVDRLDDAIAHLSALTVARATLSREIARLAAAGTDVRTLRSMLRDHDRELRGLRSAVLRLRMVPVAEILDRVPLIVRGLRRSTGKNVRLEIDAGRAELDKSVAERIFPAIVHLVRNAVDHAIEPPEERIAAGKPPDGLLRIDCRARGNGQLEVIIRDDGRGVDAAEIARRAGRDIPATNAQLLQLLFRRGLSTRDEVTHTSGRGMGMDIVRRAVVDQLGGEIVLQTTPGEGSAFTLRVPLTVSVVDAFAFECGSQPFLVPLSTVDSIVELDPKSVVRPPGRGGIGMLSRHGETVPLVWLDALLGLPVADRERPKAMIIRREDLVLAFAIDRMLGQQEVVVRPLTDPLVTVTGIAGAADLGDGRATLVVDLYALGSGLAGAPGVSA